MKTSTLQTHKTLSARKENFETANAPSWFLYKQKRDSVDMRFSQTKIHKVAQLSHKYNPIV